MINSRLDFHFFEYLLANNIQIIPEKIDDLGSYKIARDIKNRIEQELQYPGTIKVTVIRETRAVEEAK